MINRSEICMEARSWFHTPYQHQQMVKGPLGGVDCAMFVVGVALSCGLIGEDLLDNIPPYPRDWHLHQEDPMLTSIMESFGCKKKKSLRPFAGDIVVFSLKNVPCHLGIMLEDNTFIHANAGSIQKVVVTPLERFWKKHLTELYKFPGVR